MPICRNCERDLHETAFEYGGPCRKGGKRQTRRKICRRCRAARGAPPAPEFREFARRITPAKRYIVTAAQNRTPVHAKFFRTLLTACEHLGAELIVVPYRYRNPTGWLEKSEQDDERWDSAVEPYLYNQRKKLCPNLVLAADVRVAATSANPLGGFESLTGGESCLIGHPKMQLRSVPVPQGRYPKLLSTTGACTERNLSQTKAGALAEFHHFLGAVLVEVDGKTFHLRQLNADRETGSFIDLDTEYRQSSVRPAPRALALVTGDTHVRFHDAVVERATFGHGGMVDVLNPQEVIFHDLFDGYSVNPHHSNDPFIAQAKFQARLGDVRAEVEQAVAYVAERCKGRRGIIVPSNHDNFLARWVRSTDWRLNPATAAFYLETAQAMLASVRVTSRGTEYEDPFRYWVERLKGNADIVCLRVDESHQVGGIELGQHGDRGPNGARGTLKNLSRLGTRIITGHSHSPGIEEGHYQVGTSTPRRLEYTHGPSSWLNTHCVVYANGKRSLIHVIDGKWRLDEK